MCNYSFYFSMYLAHRNKTLQYILIFVTYKSLIIDDMNRNCNTIFNYLNFEILNKIILIKLL